MVKSRIGRVAAVLAALAIPAGGLMALTSGLAGAATTNTVHVTAGVVGLGVVTCAPGPVFVPWATLADISSGVCTATGLPASLSNFTKDEIVTRSKIPSPDILVMTPTLTFVVCDVSINRTILLTENTAPTTYTAVFKLGVANGYPFQVYSEVGSTRCTTEALTGATVSLVITVT